MAQKKVYDKEFKIQAVKLVRESGFSKAAKELAINTDMLYGWKKCQICEITKQIGENRKLRISLSNKQVEK